MNDAQLLRQCLHEIENSLGWGDCALWTNNEYQKLSLSVSEKTGILVSVSTIRRLYKSLQGDLLNNPQMETKNALAKFLGYKSWGEYVETKEQISPPKENTGLRKSLAVSAVFVTLLVVVIVFYGIRTKHIKAHPIECEVENLIANKVPHTVTVKYKIRDPKQQFAIDFGEQPITSSNKVKSVKLNPEQDFVSYTYRTKSEHTIRLINRSTKAVLRSWPVAISTNGWESYALQDKRKAKFGNNRTWQDGNLWITNEDIASKHFDLFKDYRTVYRNIGNIKFNGDSLHFETRLKSNLRDGFVECQHFQIELRGGDRRIFLSLAEDNCKSAIRAAISKKDISGIEKRFRTKNIDLSKWASIKIITKNKHCKFYFNDELILETNYNVPLSELNIIRYEFNVNGKIDDLKIKNSVTGEEVYKEDFSSEEAADEVS